MARTAPPQHGRFQTGQSGNPKGRPKKQVVPPATSAFDIVMERTLTVMQAGAPREMTVDEALGQRTYQEALAGDKMAQRAVFKMIARHEQAKHQRKPAKARPVAVLMEHSDPRNADRALQILDIAAINPARSDWETSDDHLLLQPWAVQAALSRRHGRRLSAQDIAEVKRCTRDPGTIAWPEPFDQ